MHNKGRAKARAKITQVEKEKVGKVPTVEKEPQESGKERVLAGHGREAFSIPDERRITARLAWAFQIPRLCQASLCLGQECMTVFHPFAPFEVPSCFRARTLPWHVVMLLGKYHRKHIVHGKQLPRVQTAMRSE